MTDSKETSVPAWRRWLSVLLIVPSFVLSWLTVIKAPTNFLWYVEIFYTELGHIFALFLLVGCLLVDRSTWKGKLLGIAGIVGMGLCLYPVVQAMAMAPGLTERVQLALGPQPSLQGKAVSGQESPVMTGRLFWIKSTSVKRTSYTIKIPGKDLLLDLYQRREGAKVQPLVVFIHGGAWRTGGPRMTTATKRYLAARGYTVAAISYRFAPKHKFPSQLQDVKTSLEWLQQRAKTLQIDPKRIALMGRSAGGHLSVLAGYRKLVPGIRAVVDFYGPTDLHWSWANPANPRVINSTAVIGDFLGGSPKQVKKAFDNASPIQFVTAQSPPTLLIYGKMDAIVSYRHGRRLVEKLKQHNVKHFLLELPWATHGCDVILIGPCSQVSLYVIERFLQKYL